MAGRAGGGKRAAVKAAVKCGEAPGSPGRRLVGPLDLLRKHCAL